MSPLRLGIIGLGLIWIRTHRPILEKMADSFTLAAFCDVSEQRRATVAKDFPSTPVFSDYEQLLALPDIEAVLVLTPLALNAPTALAALKAGKHVIMEKPIARSVAEGQALITAAQAAGRRLLVTEQAVYGQAAATLAGLMTSGEIGEVIGWNRVLHLEADPEQGELSYASTPWRKAADFPLGTLFDGGIHLIANLTQLFGVPDRVMATGRKLRPEYGEYDQVAMMLQYAGQRVGMLSYSNCLPPLQNHFHIRGTQGVITVENKQLVVEIPHQPARIINLPPENIYVNMWQALAQAHHHNSNPYYTPERALQDVAILERVNQSIKTGQPVQIAQQSVT